MSMPDQNKPIPTDCDAATIILTRRELLLLAELLENPPPRNAPFLRAQGRLRRLTSASEPLSPTPRRIGIAKGLPDLLVTYGDAGDTKVSNGACVSTTARVKVCRMPARAGVAMVSRSPKKGGRRTSLVRRIAALRRRLNKF